MGSSSNKKSALILCGDYMEDYEVMVPFQVLQAFGVRVDCASPGKVSGDKCLTAIHDYMGFELYTELTGHLFTLNTNFTDLQIDSYDCLIIPGGRFTELLSADDDAVTVVKRFSDLHKPIITSCHSQIMLVAAGVLNGKQCTAFPSMKPVIELAGGIWWEEDPAMNILEISGCVMDGNVLSAIGWPAHATYLDHVLRSIGARVERAGKMSVLFLCADYVEDYEIYVPFKALAGLGCKVDAVCPSKKKGASCVTAIHDDEGAQICSEKRGHNFAITKEWSEVNVDDYDCIVVPGGRSPELLVMNEKVVQLVKEFAEKDKVVAGVGQGLWLLAAAGVLKEKRCAGSAGMKAIIKVAGGDLVKSADCINHDKLVTATGWSALPSFISQLSSLLGITVSF